MTFILDTDTLIFMVRGLKIALPKNGRQKHKLQLAQRILNRCRDRRAAGDNVGLSAITVAELEYGARRSGDYPAEIGAVRKVLMPFVLYDFDAIACAERYGEVRDTLERVGKPIGAMDLLIAAHALGLGATLVTNNVNDFSRVLALECENWTV